MNLKTSKENHLYLIEINRPESLNALNTDTLEELSEALDQAEEDPTVRVVLITGAGDKAFVAGADIKEFSHYTAQEGQELSQTGHDTVFNKIEHLKKPVIAAINGYALGGGLELALACHIRYASDNAKLGFPEVTLGLIPGYGGTQRLPKIVGKGLANEFIFSAKMYSAQRCKEIGLVNEVFPLEELLPKAKELADRIAHNSPTAISKAIEVINAYDTPTGFEKEIQAFGSLFDTADKQEGVKAFMEKRKPRF